jgi:two-component system, repressor protein LuxO
VAPREAPFEIVPLSEVERVAIESAIAHFDGNVIRAAAALGVSPSTIYRKRQEWKSNALEAAS